MVARSLLNVWSRLECGGRGGHCGVEVVAVVVGQSVRTEARKEKQLVCVGAASL
jgi:hypothetical protein